MPHDAILSVTDVAKTFNVGAAAAVNGVSFDVKAGEFFTLLGPSGCGKTTTLRLIAGLEQADRGRIALDGRIVSDTQNGDFVAAHKRDIAMVFQSYAIWPHMTVIENVLFPLESDARLPKEEHLDRAKIALDQVGLKVLADRSATLLSGGQQQRVALARAIVRGAKLILLDEPLSNLDAALREQMRTELLDLQRRLGTTMIYVTHDQEEALQMSDRIALMRNGDLADLGAPQDLYLKPRSPFVASFLGRANFLSCEVGQGGSTVKTELGPVQVAQSGSTAGKLLMIRPEHIRLRAEATDASLPNQFSGEVRTARFAGRTVSYDVAIGITTLSVMATSGEIFAQGDKVSLMLPPARCIIMSED